MKILLCEVARNAVEVMLIEVKNHRTSRLAEYCIKILSDNFDTLGGINSDMQLMPSFGLHKLRRH